MRSVQESHLQPSYLQPDNNKYDLPENSPPRPNDHSALLGLNNPNSLEKINVSNFHKSTVYKKKMKIKKKKMKIQHHHYRYLSPFNLLIILS